MKPSLIHLAILLTLVIGANCNVRGSWTGEHHEPADHFRPETYSSSFHRRLAAAPVDVLFVIDESNSMKDEQDDVRERVKEIFNQLPPNSAVGLVGYGNEDDLIRVHTPLTTDSEQFQAAADALETDGGDEPGYMALVKSVSDDLDVPLGFRGTRFCTILITDEPSNNDAGVTQEETIDALNGGTSSGLQSVFIGITTANIVLDSYDDIAAATGGTLFRLQDFRRDASFVLMPVLDACTVAVLDNIILDPAYGERFVGENHTITATVLDIVGYDVINATVIEEGIFDPQQGVLVTFEVISGPNQGTSGVCTVNADCTTDNAGMVNFTYFGDGGVGVDIVQACFTDSELGIEKCAEAQVEWLDPPSTITLTQDVDELYVGETHMINGTIIKGAGSIFYPLTEAGVTFTIESGPNAGVSGTCGVSNPNCETDADGSISFSYVGDGGDGTDVVKACVTGGDADECSTLEVLWKHVPVSGITSETPPTTEHFIGETYTCVVHVTVSRGDVVIPLPDVSVNFTIGSGPNAGESGTCSANADCTTDDNGNLEISYIGDGGNGTDTITACFIESNVFALSEGTKKCIIFDVLWKHVPVTVIHVDAPNTERYVGDTHVIVASVVEDVGGVKSAIPDVHVNFNVKTGPNAGESGSCDGEDNCVTDEDGTITFRYEGNGGDGTDVIEACTTDLYDGSERCDTAEVIWTIPGDPSATPTTAFPSYNPTLEPTAHPSVGPSSYPTSVPSIMPSSFPSSAPTANPSEVRETTPPTPNPSPAPSLQPSQEPSPSPSQVPSQEPSPSPSQVPSQEPSPSPSQVPSQGPTPSPTALTDAPTTRRTNAPTTPPSAAPKPSQSPAADSIGTEEEDDLSPPTEDNIDTEQEDDLFPPTVSPSSLPSSTPSAVPSDGISIRLDMPSNRPLLNETHVINCTVVETSDGEVTATFPDVEVTFTILTGPNMGSAGSCRPSSDCKTDESGHVEFEYRGDGGIGTDEVEACCIINGAIICESTEVEWRDGQNIESSILPEGTCDTAKKVTVVPLAVFVCIAVVCLIICCLYMRHIRKEDPNSDFVQVARVCAICCLIVIIVLLILLVLANVEESGLC